MDTRKEWIFVLTLVAICLGMRGKPKCEDKKPNQKCSSDCECPTEQHGSQWIATVTCNDIATCYTCPNGNSDQVKWTLLDKCPKSDSSLTDSVASTSLASTSGNTTETVLSDPDSVTTTTNTTTTIASLTMFSGNYTDTVLFQKHPDGNIALYVGVACAIVVLVILVVLLIVWRRKKSHNKDTHHNGIAVHNQSYRRHDWTNTNDTPIQMSDLSSRGDDNEYSEIPADTITSFNENESAYNIIDLPNGVHDNYSHVTSKTAAGNDTTYSHMPEYAASKITNNTYAHIGNDSSMPQVELKPADDADDTYNKLQTLPNNGLQNKLRKPYDEMIDQDTEYNHLAADLKRPIEVEEEELGDTYSHLCQSGKQNLEHAEQGKTTQSLIQQTDVVVNNNGDSVEDKSGYESVSGVSPPYLEFKVEDQVDCDESNIQFGILESPTNETEDNEVQTDHHYFTLEKRDS